MSLEGPVVDEDSADTFLHTRKEQMVKEMKVPVSFHKIRKKNAKTIPVMFLSLSVEWIELVDLQISMGEAGSSDFFLGFLEASENLC